MSILLEKVKLLKWFPIGKGTHMHILEVHPSGSTTASIASLSRIDSLLIERLNMLERTYVRLGPMFPYLSKNLLLKSFLFNLEALEQVSFRSDKILQ